MVWLSSRGLAKGALPTIILFALAAILAAVLVVQYEDRAPTSGAPQPRSAGTQLEVHRVYDDLTDTCFMVVVGAGAFQVDCTPRFKDLAEPIREQTRTIYHGPVAFR